MIRKKQQGFTLLELLMVIAILGLIAVITLAALESSRSKSRDANRISQTQEILKALELYYSNNGVYPDDGNVGVGAAPVPASVIESDLANAGLLARIPADPLYDASEGYLYCAADGRQTMALLVHLEGSTGTTHCAVSRGQAAFSSDVCGGLATLDRCADVF